MRQKVKASGLPSEEQHFQVSWVCLGHPPSSESREGRGERLQMLPWSKEMVGGICALFGRRLLGLRMTGQKWKETFWLG